MRLLIAQTGSLLLLLCLMFTACEDTDIGMATQAGIDAVKAATLSDEEEKRLSVGISSRAGARHRLAPPGHPQARRIERLMGTGGRTPEGGFNVRVYLSSRVNAFAMADGSIRIYSGLMNMMDDPELLFALGHEMGHIENKHVKKNGMVAEMNQQTGPPGSCIFPLNGL